MNKILITFVLLIPSISFAWSTPYLESDCLGGKNSISITLPIEVNYVIEFSSTEDFDSVHEVDFVHSGKHVMYSPIDATTLYARFKLDKSIKTSVVMKNCVPESPIKNSSKRKHKSGYIRRPSVFANPIGAILPLFDLPLFDYPVFNLKD